MELLVHEAHMEQVEVVVSLAKDLVKVASIGSLWRRAEVDHHYVVGSHGCVDCGRSDHCECSGSFAYVQR